MGYGKKIVLGDRKKENAETIARIMNEAGFDVVPAEMELTLYFHSALEGMKLDLIKKDNRAAFEMDCEGELEYHREKGYCTYNYASVIGMGKITFVEKDEEKIYCLEKLMEHYHSGEKAPFSKAALPRTTVYKLEVETITGKRKASPKSVK